MKKTRKNIITVLIAMMLTVNTFASAVYAEGEPETSEEPIQTQENAEVEEIKEEKTEEVIEVKEASEEMKEETVETVSESKEETKIEEIKEEVKEEVKEETAQAQTEAEKVEAPKQEIAIKSVPVDETLTLHVTNILWTIKNSSNGKVRPYSTDQKISKNGSKSMTATAVMNWAGGKNMKSADENYSYTFLNGYVLSDGNGIVIRESLSASETLSKIQNKGNGNIIITFADGSTMNYEGYELTISPVYSAVEQWHLELRYTDNISTGSGSWSGTATSLTHTFRNPESQLHYQFLYWENQSNGARYSNDQKVTFNSSNTPSGTLDVYAIWKPSVTVNYYDHEGKLFNSIESFEKIDVYDVTAAQIDGCEFLGWKADDAILEEDAAYVAPSAVSQRVSRYEIDVHAVYSTSYTVEHYLEDLDGEYVLEESTLVENVLLGSDISTEANEYTGFTFNEEIEGTMTEGKATANAVLRFYYTRNSYNVIYSYGEAPKGASELPAAASYKYGASVQIEKNASAPGYRFSGWDIDEDFEMPAEDVLISGSFTAKPKKVSEETTVTNVPDEPEVIITPEVRNTPTTPKTDDTVTVIEIKEEAVPSAKNTESEGPVIEVLDEEVPMANVNNSWALINLLAAVISTLVSLLMILSFFRKEEDEEEKNRENENEETKRSSSKFLGLLPTIVSWFAFFLTEDMRNPMVLIDRYTIIMLVIMIITMVMAYITRNRKDTKEEDLTVATELQ